MSEYVRTLLLIGVLAAFLETALPLHRDRLLPYVRFVIGLGVILVLVKPVAGFLKAPHDFIGQIGSFFSETDEADDSDPMEAVLEKSASALADGVVSFLEENYEIAPAAVHISVSLDADDTENVRILGMKVVLDENALPALVTPVYLSARLSDLVGAPVTVESKHD